LHGGDRHSVDVPDRLAAADRHRVGEIADARAGGPIEIDVGRPAASAPQRRGVLDRQAEGGAQAGALLGERPRIGEGGARLEDHEPAAAHERLDRVVPARGAGKDEQARPRPPRERGPEAGARLGKRAGRTPRGRA